MHFAPIVIVLATVALVTAVEHKPSPWRADLDLKNPSTLRYYSDAVVDHDTAISITRSKLKNERRPDKVAKFNAKIKEHETNRSLHAKARGESAKAIAAASVPLLHPPDSAQTLQAQADFHAEQFRSHLIAADLDRRTADMANKLSRNRRQWKIKAIARAELANATAAVHDARKATHIASLWELHGQGVTLHPLDMAHMENSRAQPPAPSNSGSPPQSPVHRPSSLRSEKFRSSSPFSQHGTHGGSPHQSPVHSPSSPPADLWHSSSFSQHDTHGGSPHQSPVLHPSSPLADLWHSPPFSQHGTHGGSPHATVNPQDLLLSSSISHYGGHGGCPPHSHVLSPHPANLGSFSQYSGGGVPQSQVQPPHPAYLRHSSPHNVPPPSSFPYYVSGGHLQSGVPQPPSSYADPFSLPSQYGGSGSLSQTHMPPPFHSSSSHFAYGGGGGQSQVIPDHNHPSTSGGQTGRRRRRPSLYLEPTDSVSGAEYPVQNRPLGSGVSQFQEHPTGGVGVSPQFGLPSSSSPYPPHEEASVDSPETKPKQEGRKRQKKQ